MIMLCMYVHMYTNTCICYTHSITECPGPGLNLSDPGHPMRL